MTPRLSDASFRLCITSVCMVENQQVTCGSGNPGATRVSESSVLGSGLTSTNSVEMDQLDRNGVHARMSVIIIIIIQDLYSAMESQDTEALDVL